MPDYPTNVPAAGWYTDPSNPAQERWWGGVEWTHDVRPLAAPIAAPQPELANVPGGGINPFAAIDAQEASQSAGGFGDSFAQPASSFSSFSSFDTGSLTATPDPYSTSAPQSSFAVNPSWYDSSRRAEPTVAPTNGLATAGLVLSLVGLNVPGIVFSILGLRKARRFDTDGELPVGRKRSRWGLGLGIASFIISVALLAAYLFAFQYFYNLYLGQNNGGVVQTEQPTVTAPTVDDGSYVRADYEQAIRDEYAEDGYPAPDSVTCQDTGSTIEGVIVCEIVTGTTVETRTAEYSADGSYSISTVSMSQ